MTIPNSSRRRPGRALGLGLLAVALTAGCLGGAWRRTVAEDTPAAYYRYLREHGDSKYAAEARERLEYHKVLTNPSLAGYEAFQKRHPQSPLLARLRPALEQSAFDFARARGTSQAYRAFLTDYPEGALAARAIGNASYLEADGFAGDAARLADFARIHPASDFAAEAERSAETVALRAGAGKARLGLRMRIDDDVPEARRVRQTLLDRIQEHAMRAGVVLTLLPDAGSATNDVGMLLEVSHREDAVEQVAATGGLARPGVLGVTRIALRDAGTGDAIAERSFEIRLEDKAHVPGTSVLFSGAAPRYWQQFFVPFAHWNNDRTVRPAMKLGRPVVDVASGSARAVVLFEDGDFEVFDLADPEKPVPLLGYERGENYKKWSGIRVVGERVAIFGEEGLELIRLDTGRPVRERSWTRGEIGRVLGAAAVGGELVIVGAKGMQVVDLEQGTIRRAMRRVIQGIGSAGSALVFADGDSIFVSNLELLVDERVIAQMKLGRTFAPSQVRVVDRMAIVTGPGGVVVVDVAVPDKPRVVSKLFARELGDVFDATKIDGRIFLVGQRGLQVLTPRLDGVEEVVDVGTRRRVAAMGRHLVTADGAGLQVVDGSPWAQRAVPAATAH